MKWSSYNKKVDFGKILTTDLNGRMRGVQVNAGNIEKILSRGVGFDGSSIAGMGTVDESDRVLVPVPESHRIIDFGDEKIGLFAGKIYEKEGVRSRSDPRLVLERVMKIAKAKGYGFLIGPEHEFFLLKSEEFNANIHTDASGYFDIDPHDTGEEVRKDIIKALLKSGIGFEKAHHEVTASQHEINVAPEDPLSAADTTLLVRFIIKSVAKKHGLYATFMPKPFDGENRNAFHMHLSMVDEKGKNLFYKKGRKYNLSTLGRCFIGGVLKYARDTSIVMASTVNSYKAYVMEREAPISIGWGIRNRSSMLRLPYSSEPHAMRIELRSPDPSGNVYLQMAAFIAAGLHGIEEKTDCGEPDTGSTYKKKSEKVLDRHYLPKTTFEALAEAQESDFLRDVLGDYIYNNYIRLKVEEWEEFRVHVTPFEQKKYMSL